MVVLLAGCSDTPCERECERMIECIAPSTDNVVGEFFTDSICADACGLSLESAEERFVEAMQSKSCDEINAAVLDSELAQEFGELFLQILVFMGK